MKMTPYKDVNEVLDLFAQRIKNIFGSKLVGIYLTGSLSYGDFQEGRSDIDLVVVLKSFASETEQQTIKKLHEDLERQFLQWAKRIECSYIPVDMLSNVESPKTPRPYFGEGIFYPEAPFGNEWLINNYLLYQHGIALFGPDFKTLIKPIDISDVQKASARDLYIEWQPKITDPEYLNNSHYQSYVVLNLCRILYTVIGGVVASKKASAAWVKKELPQWKKLIETAEAWTYGVEMSRQEETIRFIQFALEKVKTK